MIKINKEVEVYFRSLDAKSEISKHNSENSYIRVGIPYADRSAIVAVIIITHIDKNVRYTYTNVVGEVPVRNSGDS